MTGATAATPQPSKQTNVSFVIINWNRKDDLDRTLASIMAQEYAGGQIEIVLVDNASTDGSIEMVRTKYPQVRLFVMHSTHYGATEELNMGMATATGDIVAVLDNDATVEKNWAAKVVEKFASDPEIGAVASRIMMPDDSKQGNFKLQWPDYENYGGVDVEKEFETQMFYGAAFAVRREVLKKAGYYPDDFFLYWNESDLSAKIYHAGYSIRYYPDIVAYHFCSTTMRMNWKFIYYNMRNPIWLAAKYLSLKEALVTIGYRMMTMWSFATRMRLWGAYFRAIADAVIGLPRQLKQRRYSPRFEQVRNRIVRGDIPLSEYIWIRLTKGVSDTHNSVKFVKERLSGQQK